MEVVKEWIFFYKRLRNQAPIICGARHWNQIAEFGRERETWLKQFIKLSNGIPSHQTFCRVLGLIPPEELMKCFIAWSSATTPLSPNDVIAIDGKTVRGSSHSAMNRGPLHLINAYVAEKNVTLGAVKTPDKSNEIKGIPLLLKSLNIKDCIITIDAMATQKGITKLIRLKGAHYVLALKGNQGKLCRQEDVCRIYHPRAAENFSTLRKLVLQLLEKERSFSQGIPFKQWKAALSCDYLQKVIGF